MKRKLIVMLLVLTMVLGLASCGSKKSGSGEASLSAQVETISEMKANYAEVTIDIDTDLFAKANLDVTKPSLKLAIQADQDNEKVAKMEISYKLDSNDYTKLTTMIVDDQVVYLNLKELKEVLPGLLDKFGASEYSAVISMLPDAEYVKVDPKVLQDLTGGTSEESISSNEENANGVVSTMSVAPGVGGLAGSMSLSKEDTKKIMKMLTEVVKAVEEAIKDVEPAVIAGNDEKVTFNLSNKNAKATIEALAKYDFSKCFDAVIDQMEGIEAYKEIADEYKGQKADILKEIKEAFEEGSKELTDDADFALNYTCEISGSSGKRVAEQTFSMNGKVEGESIKMTIASTIDESKEETVEVPTDAIDYMEIMSALMGGMSY